MMEGLNGLGWEVYQSDHEDANGQYEINFVYTDALTTADRLHLLQDDEQPSSSKIRCHLNLHGLSPSATGPAAVPTSITTLPTPRPARTCIPRRVRPPRSRPLRLGLQLYRWCVQACPSPLCRNLAYRQPATSAYKSVQRSTAPCSGFLWTPAFITYGDNNRTQMVRTRGPRPLRGPHHLRWLQPLSRLGCLPSRRLGRHPQTVLTLANPTSATCTPSAWRKSSAVASVSYPQSLPEALDHLGAGPSGPGCLRGPIGTEFLGLKRAEWRQYHRTVGAWEIDRYLNLF